MTRKNIFVDTSAWYALADAGDFNHRKARTFFTAALADYRELVTTNHVIGESYTLLRYRLGHDISWKFLGNIRKSQKLRSIFVSEELEQKAYRLLEHYPDQKFSFVDGTSFTLMKEQNISDCFAFDRHFFTAGFTILPV